MTRAEKKALKAEQDKRKRRVLVGTLILNFGILILLKYQNIVFGLGEGLGRAFGLAWDRPSASIIVPLGISYYTFQAMGYLLDLYRRKYAPERLLGHFLLFISFFPQLIQGPISRYDELSGQLLSGHRYDFTWIKHGAVLIGWGLFKKLVISDRIAIMTGAIYAAPDQYSGWYLVAATVMGMLQLYTDFSGGIDMTRGVAQMFGIILPDNFLRPFFATSLREYWQRWHITLNNWWRDYIFYPFTLSKPLQRLANGAKKVFGQEFGKKVPVVLAIILIRIINSIWHGASGGSILCGSCYGITLALAFCLEPAFKKLTVKLRINTQCLSWRIFQCLRTFFLIAMPRLAINAVTLKEGFHYIECMFRKNNPWILFDGSLYKLGVSQDACCIISMGLLVLLAVSCMQEKGVCVRAWLDRQNLGFRWLVYIGLACAILVFGVYGAGYNAGAFVYQQV